MNKNGLAFIKTHHSLQEGTGRTKSYIQEAVNRGIRQLAMVDRNTLSDMVTFYDLCHKAGIEPILGVTLSLFDPNQIKQVIEARNPKLQSLYSKLLTEDELSTAYTSLRTKNKLLLSEKTEQRKVERCIDALLDAIKPRKLSSLNSALRIVKKLDFPFFLTASEQSKYLSEEESEALNEFLSEDNQTTLINSAMANYLPYEDSDFPDITLIAGSDIGFKNIKSLVSWAWTEGQSPKHLESCSRSQKVKITLNHLKERSKGVYCIAGLEGDLLGKSILSNDHTATTYAIDTLKEIYGTQLIIGVERSADPEVDGEVKFARSEEVNDGALAIAEKHQIPAIAINYARYVNKDDLEAHDVKDALLNDVQLSNMNRERKFLSGQYLSNWEDLREQFSDLPTLVDNAENIMDYLSTNEDGNHKVTIELDVPVLPESPIPEGFTPNTYIRHLAKAGLDEHLDRKHRKQMQVDDLSCISDEQKAQIASDKQEYTARLNYELNIIDNMGFIGYFLIVADFIQWAKTNGIQVGGGRGSGAGSLTAYCLKITNIDPITHDLLFERFLNPERVFMPDFDIDFGSGYHPETGKLMTRDHVIEYVCDLYNDPSNDFPSVAQIITHGQMLPKSGTRAIGKSLGLSLRFTEDLVNEYENPSERKMADIIGDPVINARLTSEPSTARLLRLVMETEALKKNTGVHAGGVVIARGDITNFTSVQCPIGEPDKLITQADKGDVERAGLVKFDFLGLSNLTTIALCLHYIYKNTGVRIDLDEIRMDDEATYELLRSANAHGVFQVESAGMRDLLRRVQVENIEEYSALIALFRPGPLQSGMVDNFIDRKHGREEISYPDAQYQHELLKPILEPTYGIILYQEQVMQIAQVLAKYSLGGADLLRRAMGKKKIEEMEKQRATFESGAIENNVDGELAIKIFDLVEKFAGYGFNKSHSMAYAYISYHTAWLKTHYLTEYMAAVLTGQVDDHDELELTLADCYKNGIKILPPDINKSESNFTTEGDLQIRYGLSAIKDVGAANLDSVLKEREKNGNFTSAIEMKARCGSSLNSSVLNALVLSGALDKLDTHFKLPLEGIEKTVTPEPLYQTPKVQSEITDLKADIIEYERRFDSVTGFGIELQKIIRSLCVHYARKYDVAITEDAPLKQKLSALWSFFSYRTSDECELPEEQKEVIKADFDALRSELKGRANSAEAFKNYKHTLEHKKFKLNELTESLSNSVREDEYLRSRWETENNEIRFPDYEKRRFHLFETSMLKNVKAPHIKKGMNTILFAALKDYHDEMKERVNSVATKISYLIGFMEVAEFTAVVEDKYREMLGQDLIEVTSDTVEATVDAFTKAKGKKINAAVTKKLHNELIQLLLRDSNILYHFGSKALSKDTPQLSGKDRLAEEMEKLSYYATGHPLDLDNLRSKLKGQGKYTDMIDLTAPDTDPITKKPLMERYQRTAGIITNARPLVVKKDGKLKGRKMMALTLSDGTSSIRVTAFPDTFDKIKDMLFVGSILCLSGNVEVDEFLGDGTLKLDIDVIHCTKSGRELFKAPSRYKYKRQEKVDKDQKLPSSRLACVPTQSFFQ